MSALSLSVDAAHRPLRLGLKMPGTGESSMKFGRAGATTDSPEMSAFCKSKMSISGDEAFWSCCDTNDNRMMRGLKFDEVPFEGLIVCRSWNVFTEGCLFRYDGRRSGRWHWPQGHMISTIPKRSFLMTLRKTSFFLFNSRGNGSLECFIRRGRS